ncbi:MAG: NAD-dependent epimerase/dehydratase family protein [Actinomycetota bacterium]|nr:NAD-dependent epimerase/dehydratase family protein [Actinomycetota bacterium]
MTVLVTGGTGFLGESLVRRLLAGGARVRVLVRSPMKAKPLRARGVEAVVGDVSDATAVAAALQDVAVVYHLAGRLLAPGVPATEYHKTHVDGTRILLAACQRASRLERFVHCSTTGVLGVTGDRPADETAPFRPTNVYEATKAEAELTVRAAWREGFPAVIARPGLVYGPGDLHLLAFFRSVLRRRFRPIGRRPIWLHPIYIDDVTEALVRCGQRAAAVGECFHIAGREPVTLAGLAEAIARAAGTRLPPGHIPLAPARALAALGDCLPANLRQSAPLTRSRLEFLTHSRVYDVTHAQRLLDFVAATDLPTGTARSMAWYRRQGYVAMDAPRIGSTRRGAFGAG